MELTWSAQQFAIMLYLQYKLYVSDTTERNVHCHVFENPMRALTYDHIIIIGIYILYIIYNYIYIVYITKYTYKFNIHSYMYEDNKCIHTYTEI